MSSRIQIHEAMADVVAATKTKLGLSVLNYLYGTLDDLTQDLRDMTQSQTYEAQKYPLVWLPMDITEVYTNNDFIYTANVNLVICDATRATYRTGERFANTFAPTLQPIYEELLNQLVLSSYFAFGDASTIEHSKTDRIAWGKKALITLNGQGVDFVDAIELTNLKLLTKFKDCNKKWQI